MQRFSMIRALLPLATTLSLVATLLLATLGLAACSGIDTEIKPQPGFDPAQYRHYAWATPPLLDSRDARLLEVDKAVRAAVDGELQRQGFARVDNAAADALIDYRLAERMDISHAGSNSPRDDAARAMDLNRNSATDTAVYNHPTLPYIERVELLLSIQARRSGVIVWEGSATKNVDDMNQHFADADIERAVALLLKRLKR